MRPLVLFGGCYVDEHGYIHDMINKRIHCTKISGPVDLRKDVADEELRFKEEGLERSINGTTI